MGSWTTNNEGRLRPKESSLAAPSSHACTEPPYRLTTRWSGIGIEPALADRIMEARPFETLEDLQNIKEIGPSLLERLSAVAPVIELLSRARLYLSQSNFGLARQDVQAARDLLAGLQSDMPADKSANLQGVIARLDLALGNLPDFPVIAVDDVDIAWQMLVNGLSDLATSTPQPTIELSTSTTEAPATATPIPAAEIMPTATP